MLTSTAWRTEHCSSTVCCGGVDHRTSLLYTALGPHIQVESHNCRTLDSLQKHQWSCIILSGDLHRTKGMHAEWQRTNTPISKRLCIFCLVSHGSSTCCTCQSTSISIDSELQTCTLDTLVVSCTASLLCTTEGTPTSRWSGQSHNSPLPAEEVQHEAHKCCWHCIRQLCSHFTPLECT